MLKYSRLITYSVVSRTDRLWQFATYEVLLMSSRTDKKKKGLTVKMEGRRGTDNKDDGHRWNRND